MRLSSAVSARFPCLTPSLSASSLVSSIVLVTSFSIIPALFPDIFLPRSSIPLWSTRSTLLSLICFSISNLIYFSHSDIPFSLRDTHLALLCSLYSYLPHFSQFFFTLIQSTPVITLSYVWYDIPVPSLLCLIFPCSYLVSPLCTACLYQIVLDWLSLAHLAQFCSSFCSYGLSIFSSNNLPLGSISPSFSMYYNIEVVNNINIVFICTPH